MRIFSRTTYKFNYFLGSAQLIILSVTDVERRQMNTSLKKKLVDEVLSHSNCHTSANNPELEREIIRQLTEPTMLLHLVDYSSREDYNQTNSTDLRRVLRMDVMTSLRLVQCYQTTIHRLCQLYRSHLRLTPYNQQQRHLILVARDDYYLLDLVAQKLGVITDISNIRQRQHDIFKREVNNAIQQPFDCCHSAKQQKQKPHILEQQHRQRQQHRQFYKDPSSPSEHLLETQFHLG